MGQPTVLFPTNQGMTNTCPEPARFRARSEYEAYATLCLLKLQSLTSGYKEVTFFIRMIYCSMKLKSVRWPALYDQQPDQPFIVL
jgi:hypothetical protein